MLRIERVVAAALAGVVVSGAAAQDAVQWRVEDGGNGHWYNVIQLPQETDWYSAADAAVAIGGHLATATTASEAILLKELAGSPVGWLNRAGPWVGGFQNPSNPEYAEPSGGWEWITGEAWFPVWEADSGEPNDNGGDENFLHFVAEAGVDCAPDLETRVWNDLALTYSGTNCLQTPAAMLVEWSADCNDDGIVDYGQILDGTFADDDGDGVPDLCDAVQWQVKDGGNGHWYLAIDVVLPWQAARQLAADRGGYLATSTSEKENGYIHSLTARFSNQHFWLGASRPIDAPNPDFGWAWITGESWNWTNWAAGYPDDRQGDCYPDGEPWLEMLSDGSWNDEGYSCTPSQTNRVIIEWSADCNGDGIVDYGQILDGTYPDEDLNGVPDCCEAPCVGDLNLDNRVDSADLGLLIAAWNTDGSIVAGSDINGNGLVDAADLGLLIGAWGECGCN